MKSSPTAQPDPARSSTLHASRRAKNIFVAVVLCLAVLISAFVYLRQTDRSVSSVIPVTESTGDISAVKISLADEGIYRISLADLRQAGWTASLDDPQQIRLTRGGVELPFWVEQQSGSPSIVFYAKPPDSIYSVEDVYILQDINNDDAAFDTSPQPAAEAAPPPASPVSLPEGSYFDVRHFEQNQAYLPQAQGGEHWFWLSLPAPISQTLDIQVQDIFPLENSEDLQALLKVHLYSSTEAVQSPDHTLRLLVNDQSVLETSWDGRGEHTIEAWFNAGLLTDGDNRITLVAPGVDGVAADLSYLDWVEISYPRQLLAGDDRLAIWSPGGAIKIEGFSGPAAVFDISDPMNVYSVEGVEVQDSLVVFDSLAGHRYLAVGPQGYLSPVGISPLTTIPDLRAPDSGADYIAIGPDELLEPLTPLLDYRQDQGLKTAAVPVQAVYDQFSHGMVTPQAIQEFLRYAVSSWQPAPRYLLLVGDASYDPKGYLALPQVNQLVVPLVDTVFGGQTTSDVPFVQVNDDDWPDLAVGLVPARTPEQVDAFVHKTLSYEGSKGSSAQPGKILAVADGLEASFRSDAETFLSLFNPDYPQQLIAPQAGATGTATQIEQEMVNGASLLAYFGHGSLNMWGKDRLFTIEDAAKLDNGEQLPVVLNMTCLTGLYTHPKAESLAEAFLFNPQGGAVAVLAPSSLTLASDQSFLSRPLVEAMLSAPTPVLGDAHLQARRQVPLDSPGMRDVMMTFLLFGDPALSVPVFSPSP